LETATTLSPKPRAKRISVLLGAVETIRRGASGINTSRPNWSVRIMPLPFSSAGKSNERGPDRQRLTKRLAKMSITRQSITAVVRRKIHPLFFLFFLPAIEMPIAPLQS